MSGSGPEGGPDPKRLLADHLEFLRELGVRDLRLASVPGSPARPESPAAPAPASRPAPVPTGAAVPASPRASAPVGALVPSASPVGAVAGKAPAGSKAKALALVRETEIGDCRRCRLCEKRTNIVFGTGDPEARLMFVGEGPGHDEDMQGLPFVGRAGQLLTDIIGAMKLRREEVYIANIVKCRPPENRTPEPDEIAACRGFLEKQIDIIAPDVIVCLGAVAVQALCGPVGGITKVRGQMREYRGVPVMPTFHPAYLLRNPAAKKDVWQDMKKVMTLLADARGSS